MISNVTKNHEIVVTFTGSLSLSIGKTGSGDGTITSKPTGINCGNTCASNFKTGTKVTLTAKPNSDTLFTGWSGGGCSGTSTCKVTMNDAVSVTANFRSEAHSTVSPLNKNYGIVKPGHQSRILYREEQREETFDHSTPSVSGDTSFTVTGNTCVEKSLTTNQTCQIMVTLTPTSTHAVTASLSIPSNDIDTPVVIVSLAGNGGVTARTGTDRGEEE